MYLRNLIVDGAINFNKIRMPGLKKKKKRKIIPIQRAEI